VDGVLVGRNVGTPLHSALQYIIAAYCHQFSKEYGIKGFTECRLRMSDMKRHRIPDVMIVELPVAMGNVIRDVPAVVIEIKSPDDKFDEILGKCMEYESLGVPNILVLDPDLHLSYVFDKSALHLVKSPVRLHFPKRGSALELPMDKLFAEMDESGLD